MDEIVWGGIAAVPIVTGLVQVIGMTGWVPQRVLGLVAVALGVAGGVGFASQTADVSWFLGGLQGVSVGLGASGLYSTQKNVREQVNDGRAGD